MDGFEKQSLNGNSSGEKKSPAGLKTFDAFRKLGAKSTLTTLSLTKHSKNKSILYNPNPQRRSMDHPPPLHLHVLRLLRAENMVARHRKLPLQRGEGRLP